MHHGLHRGKEAERTAPKYATREDCVAEFGEGQCQQTPARAGVAPKTRAQAQSNGSWMPLMAGYMMGRLMGGGMAQQQPLFSSKNPASPAYGQYTDASSKRRRRPADRTMNVPKTAMAPKPATTTTVTRGGFGESVAKQSTMQRSAAGSASSSLNGRLSGMERVSITERPDWRVKATEYGFNFHTMYGEPYWSEEAYYKLTLAQVEKLEAVTAELHQMCLRWWKSDRQR